MSHGFPLRDLHSHLMHGIDDGAETLELGLEALGQFWHAGVTTVLTTPHLLGSLTLNPPALERRLAEVDRAWEALRAAGALSEPELDLRRGFEVMMDDPHLDLSDPRVRLDGGRFALVEWPRLQVPPGTGPVIQRIVSEGIVPIIAHPERYYGVDSELTVVARWRDAGARIQVNHGSILGHYGSQAQGLAFRLLRRGWVDLLSSDYHPRAGRAPEISAAAALFGELGAEEQWRLLASGNPGRILHGEDPMPVPALPEAPSFWDRVRAVIRKGVG